MNNSKAVFCRSLDLVHQLLSDENNLYINFHKQIASGSRLPKDDPWEIGRVAVEGTLFPNYHDEINIACLTLNYTGLTNYGPYSITLKDKMIATRTSVFEENPFIFMEKHKIVAGKPIPPGYRASWKTRNEFAMAKLHSKFNKGTVVKEFPEILLNCGTISAKDEFIEVHIYGPLHATVFEKIKGPKPTKKSDLAIWTSLRTKCAKLGIILEAS
jgi:hypothetical protein